MVGTVEGEDGCKEMESVRDWGYQSREDTRHIVKTGEVRGSTDEGLGILVTSGCTLNKEGTVVREGREGNKVLKDWRY